MKARTFITIFILGLILATPVVGEPNVNGGLRLLSAEATATAAAPAGNKLLQGEAAVDKLKEQGSYQSLAQAMQAARYAVEPVKANPEAASPGECYAGNPAHALRCWFRADGLELQPGAAQGSPWKFNLRLRGYGRTVLESAEVDHVSNCQNRVELSRAQGAVVEWYENKPAGLEQGFTLPRRPPGEGPLRLVLEAGGDLRPELDRSGGSAERRHLEVQEEEVRRSAEPLLREQASAARFMTADGKPALRYSGLKVWDATQRKLPAHLEVQGQQLALVVNDQTATYPVTIDPIITSQEAKLTADDGAAGDMFGSSVSLSADGSTALVGAVDAAYESGDPGRAYIFVRNGSSWSQQAKLAMYNSGGYFHAFGVSVSLSADGSTALVGDPKYGPGLGSYGSAYVFVRSESSWSQQAMLAASDGGVGDSFGNAVSLSADGNTALIGAYKQSVPTPQGSYVGSAYVFVRSGTNWIQQAKLTEVDREDQDYFGCSVSLSGDGTMALVGIEGKDDGSLSSVGSAKIFTRSGSSWSWRWQLRPAVGADYDHFGSHVSLSGDGTTALVGAPGLDGPAGGVNAGGAYVFVRSGSTWTQAKLTAGDAMANDSFGSSVSLSGDGTTALVGAHFDDTPAGGDVGSAYVFMRSGTNWSQQAKLTAGDGANSDWFGGALSLSGDGATALVGASRDDVGALANQGSAYVFRLEVSPAIINQPTNQTVVAGQPAGFSVTATGTAPLSYQWRFNGSKIAGATNSSYDIASAQSAHEGDYYVVITNAGGSVTSVIATLVVQAPPSITSPPQSQTVALGQRASFTVTAVGSAPLTYQWRRNGADIPGATGSSYTIASVQTNDARSYSVVVTNVFGSVTSADAVLTVLTTIAQWNFNSDPPDGSISTGTLLPSVGNGTAGYAGGTEANGTGFTPGSGTDPAPSDNTSWDTAGYPLQGTANKTAGVRFTVSTAGRQNIGISWDQKVQSHASKYCRLQYTTNGSLFVDFPGRLVADSASAWFYQTNSLAGLPGVDDNPNFAFRIVTEWDGAGYVTPGGGSNYDPDSAIEFDLMTVWGEVIPPVPPGILTHPTNQTVFAGQPAAFSVTATGTEPLSYQWRFNGSDIPGASTSAYVLTSAQTTNAGSYDVTVSNLAGTVSSAAAVLEVLALPSVVAQPTNQTVLAGQPAAFSVTATGTAPLRYQWRFNGSDIGGATTNTCAITSAQTTNAGSYAAVITNTYGSVTSSFATLTVLVPPTIVTQPTNQSVLAGQPAAFSVTAAGTAPLRYQWQFNGTDLTGASTSRYNIANAQSAHAGDYCVVITNAGGSVTSVTATLAVAPSPPTITSPPQSQTVALGQGASFTVTAVGSAPLGYQWRCNGTNLAGATASFYTIASVQTNDACAYSVVITNAFGSVTSGDAVLTVLDTLAQWNFNSPSPDDNISTGTLTPATGSGTAAFTGGTGPNGTVFFASGCGTDPAPSDNSGWETAGYPAQGTANKTAGVRFNVSTAGRQNIGIRWDHYINNRASRYARLQYTTNGSIFVDFPSRVVANGPSTWFQQTNSLAGLPGVDDNPNFAFRIVAEFESDTNPNYVSFGTYSPSLGTIRFDMVTVSGTLIPSVPPHIISQPASQEVLAGQPAAFSVTASGTEPLSYQWRLNDNDLPGATTNTYTITSAHSTNAGSYTVVVTNSAGSVTSSVAVLQVLCITPPLLTGVSNKTVESGSAWHFDLPTALDLCCGTNLPVTVQSTLTNGSCPCVITRTWQATDCSSNLSTCAQTITVVDTQPPALTCASNKTVAWGSQWTFDWPGASDLGCGTNVTVWLASSNLVSSVPPCTAVWQGTWSAWDCCSNAATCTQTVTVVDRTPPAIAGPTNITTTCTSTNGAQVFFTPTALDNCDPAPVITCVPPSGSYFSPGTTLVWCTASDASGNTNTFSFQVTVTDPIKPSLRITQQGAIASIFWPQTCTRYTLEENTVLGASGWLSNTAPVEVVGSEYRATIAAGTGSRFFRLRSTSPFGTNEGEVFMVGPGGGTIHACSGGVTLQIPAGALSAEVGITVRALPDGTGTPELIPGPAYEFGPDGLTFAVPIILTARYDASRLPPGANESAQMLFTLQAGYWIPLSAGTVDSNAKTITAPLQHFSSHGSGSLEYLEAHATEIHDRLRQELTDVNAACASTTDLRVKTCLANRMLELQRIVDALAFLPGFGDLVMTESAICDGLLVDGAWVDVQPASTNLQVGQTQTLTAVPKVGNQVVTGTKEIVWTSSDPGVATVANGVVTAVAPGQAQIFALTEPAEGRCANFLLQGNVWVVVENKVDIVLVAQTTHRSDDWMGFAEGYPGLNDIGPAVVSALAARFDSYRFGFVGFGVHPSLATCEDNLPEYEPYVPPTDFVDWFSLTNNPSTIASGLASFRLICSWPVDLANNGSSLYTALLHAIRDSAWRPGARKVVISFSEIGVRWNDPANDSERVTGYTKETVIAAANLAGVTILLLDGNYNNQPYIPAWQAIAAGTGGEYHLAPWPMLSSLEMAFDRISAWMDTP